jgi:ribosomal protein L24
MDHMGQWYARTAGWGRIIVSVIYGPSATDAGKVLKKRETNLFWIKGITVRSVSQRFQNDTNTNPIEGETQMMTILEIVLLATILYAIG